MPKVMGKNRARAVKAESPGMAPKTIPATTPPIIRDRVTGWNTAIKP